MLETWEPGKIAMMVSWAAIALTGYVTLAGAPLPGVQIAALLIALVALSGVAGAIAVERGYRVGDGVAIALILGVLVGIGRRSTAADRDDDDHEGRR
jgi:hypothetical protein